MNEKPLEIGSEPTVADTFIGQYGSVVLTLIGVLTIGYLQKILSLNAAPEATRLMLTGGIIICAVLFQRGKRQ